MKNILNLTSAQITAQASDEKIERLKLNSTGVVNDLTNLLLAQEQRFIASGAADDSPQAVFDIWGTEALSTLLDVKKVASGLKGRGAAIIHLREDFASPEIVNGKPTGRLVYNPLPAAPVAQND